MEQLEHELGAGFVSADEVPKTSLISFDSSDGDEIEYLCLLQYVEHGNYEDASARGWVKITGRQKVFDFLAELVRARIISEHISFIVTTTSNVENSMNVYTFMKKMADDGKVDTDFDINEYVDESVVDSDVWVSSIATNVSDEPENTIGLILASFEEE